MARRRKTSRTYYRRGYHGQFAGSCSGSVRIEQPSALLVDQPTLGVNQNRPTSYFGTSAAFGYSQADSAYVTPTIDRPSLGTGQK